ncbi:MAG TPA: hypothetical protein VMY77_10965, partial [Chitinophagaceae bacterium]|nr:hypothetical protein [Chitinophagaceae bacterium]
MVLKIFTYCFIVLGLISCSYSTNKIERLPYYSSADFMPQWLNEKEARSIHSIPDFNFIDQDGNL